MKFDVLKEPWIPTVDFDGVTQMRGILDVFKNAHKLETIESASPLVEFTLYRFLVTFLMDALRPADTYELEDILDAGKFDMKVINAYIKLCKSEGVTFDLFDKSRPFMQALCTEEKGDDVKNASILDFVRASGQNHTLFDHPGSRDDGYTPDAALRLMLTTYQFATAGGSGYYRSANGAPPLYAMVRGHNLFETLVGNLITVPDDNFDTLPVFWRRKEDVKRKGAKPGTSFLEGMMFPCRRIRLMPEEDGLVREVFFGPGEGCMMGVGFRDPNVTITEKGAYVVATESMPIWQNLCRMLDTISGASPAVVSVYDNIHMGKDDLRLTLYAAITNQAKYISAIKRDFTFPSNICQSENRIKMLHDCADMTGKVSDMLKKQLMELPFISKNSTGKKGSIKSGKLKLAMAEFHSACWDKLDEIIRESTDDAAQCEQMKEDYREVLAKTANEVFANTIDRENVAPQNLVTSVKIQARFMRTIDRWKASRQGQRKGKENNA